MVMPTDWTLRIPPSVQTALETLERAGYEVWLVGGCVRDLAIGRTPLDFDLSSNALPAQVLDVFPHAFATGIEHGTVTVLVEHHAIEITTFRSESNYSDGRRPDRVVFESDIIKDLSRRDFTINSMAYHPQRGLLDPFEGWADLMAGSLRTVGAPSLRFREDALRMLRALRFTLTYNLTPSADLVQAIELEKNRASRLSVERITHELGRMMNAAHGPALLTFVDCGLLAVIAARLFGLAVNSVRLISLLSAWIRPAWHPDQTVPLFYLACRLCVPVDSGIVGNGVAGKGIMGNGIVDNGLVGNGFSEPGPDIAALRGILLPSGLGDLKATFQQTCRLSRPASRHGHALLYGVGLRLHLDLDRELDACGLAIIVRVLSKTLALDLHTARQCAVDGWSLLLFMKPGLNAVSRELINLRQQIQLEVELAEAAIELPVSLADLAVTGKDLTAHLPLRGTVLGVYLERLLSHVQAEPADNTREKLLALAAVWTAGGSQPGC